MTFTAPRNGLLNPLTEGFKPNHRGRVNGYLLPDFAHIGDTGGRRSSGWSWVRKSLAT